MLAPGMLATLPDGVCESTRPTRLLSVVSCSSASTSNPAAESCSRAGFCSLPVTSGTKVSSGGSGPVETFS